MVSDNEGKSSKGAQFQTDVFSSKQDQSPTGKTPQQIDIVNSASVVSNGTISRADPHVKGENDEGRQRSPYMNRAKSQEISKRVECQAGSLSVQNQDIKLRVEPPNTKIVEEYNNKQRFYDSKSKNIPPWYNRTGPG